MRAWLVGLTQQLNRLSVRGRISCLALIAVVGFVANGINFISNEEQIDSALQNTNSAARMIESGLERKNALVVVRGTVNELAIKPRVLLVGTFRENYQRAGKEVGILATVAADESKGTLKGLQDQLLISH
jgi:hypothetical protein